MKKNTGFTLVEMAVVLVVIGLILSGILSTFQAQMDGAKIRETRLSLTDIREAMITFALINGRLPCPANPTLANTAAGAGLEGINWNFVTNTGTGMCQRLNGVVPWATLGVKELDSWGGRFSYSVQDDYNPDSYIGAGGGRQTRFARHLPGGATDDFCNAGHAFTIATFGLCSSSTINVNTNFAGTSNVAFGVAAVIVSHGKNRRGSFNAAGGARTAGSLGDELQNANANTAVGGALDTAFVSKPFVYHDNQLDATYYDDLTEWIPITALVGRMVSAGKLP